MSDVDMLMRIQVSACEWENVSKLIQVPDCE